MSTTNTSIAWTDGTWNPTRGCRRISPGCENCYAERQAYRFSQPTERAPQPPYEGLVTLGKSGPRWTGEGRLALTKLHDPLRLRTPKKLFVNSMSDLFYEAFSDAEIDAVLAVMLLAPEHTFQVLTKRADRMRTYLSDPGLYDRVIVQANLVRLAYSAKPEAEKIAAPPGQGIDCHPDGRWPANFATDEAGASMLDSQAGTDHRGEMPAYRSGIGFGSSAGGSAGPRIVFAPGGPSRFFYVAKASREERELGCEGLPFQTAGEVTQREDGSAGLNSPRAGAGRTSGARNHHPNVKPVELTRWLAGLILPPPRRDGVPRRLLVPYAGSGSEMIGALLAGWDLVEGIEREPRQDQPDAPDYQSILRARVAFAISNPRAFEPHAERKKDKPLDGQGSLFGESA